MHNTNKDNITYRQQITENADSPHIDFILEEYDNFRTSNPAQGDMPSSNLQNKVNPIEKEIADTYSEEFMVNNFPGSINQHGQITHGWLKNQFRKQIQRGWLGRQWDHSFGTEGLAGGKLFDGTLWDHTIGKRGLGGGIGQVWDDTFGVLFGTGETAAEEAKQKKLAGNILTSGSESLQAQFDRSMGGQGSIAKEYDTSMASTTGGIQDQFSQVTAAGR